MLYTGVTLKFIMSDIRAAMQKRNIFAVYFCFRYICTQEMVIHIYTSGKVNTTAFWPKTTKKYQYSVDYSQQSILAFSATIF